MEWIWIKNSCKSHLFQTARNFPTVKATHILKKIASWIIFHCEIYIYIFTWIFKYLFYLTVFYLTVFSKKKTTAFSILEKHYVHFRLETIKCKIFGTKLIFINCTNPKPPSPQIINVGWSVLGKNNIAVWERGEVAFFQYILHLIVVFTN